MNYFVACKHSILLGNVNLMSPLTTPISTVLVAAFPVLKHPFPRREISDIYNLLVAGGEIFQSISSQIQLMVVSGL
jgi:hypothetical protein